MPKIAYSYTRFSNPRQALGNSEERQVEYAREYAAKHDFVLEERIDRGVSAYSGKNIAGGALGVFLQQIKSGVTKPGSILIAENLDRLSRQGPKKARQLFAQIVDNGVEIHVLNLGMVLDYGWEDNPAKSHAIDSELGRAKRESEIKSERCGKAWKDKRSKANGKAAISARVPAWLSAVKGLPIQIDKERAKIVRQIYEWSAKGIGQYRICDKLIAQNVPAWGPVYKGRPPRWTPFYISSILSSRATIGEYQPYHSPKDKPRVKDGDPIPDYYPAVVPLSLWQKVQDFRRAFAQAKFGEALHAGRNKFSTANLFRKLVYDANNDVPMVYKQYDGYSCLVSTYRKHLREHRIRYQAFEEVMLGFLSAADWQTIAEEGQKIVPTELLARQEALAHLIEDNSKILDRYRAMVADPDFAGFDSIQSDYKSALLESKRLEEEHRALRAQIDACCSANQTMTETKGIAIRQGNVEERLKLRLYLAQRIKRIDLDFQAEYKGNLAIFHFGAEGRFVDIAPGQLPEGKGMVAKLTFTNHAERLVIFTPDGGFLLWMK